MKPMADAKKFAVGDRVTFARTPNRPQSTIKYGTIKSTRADDATILEVEWDDKSISWLHPSELTPGAPAAPSPEPVSK
jgi:hypothetical protein